MADPIVTVFDPSSNAPSSEDNTPDWNGFRQWRYSNPEYIALMESKPALMYALENCISQGDWAAALTVFGQLQLSAETKSMLLEGCNQFNLPEEIKAALT